MADTEICGLCGMPAASCGDFADHLALLGRRMAEPRDVYGMVYSPVIGTCDQCANGPVEVFAIDNGDASICEPCISAHSDALDAATDAARDAMSPYAAGAIDWGELKAVITVAVKVYCEYDAESP